MVGSSIADSLIAVRENAGYSVDELADLTNINEEQIIAWEKGQEEPKISECILLSKLYGVELDDIFGGCKAEDYLAEEKWEDFKYNAWVNRIANRRYAW